MIQLPNLPGITVGSRFESETTLLIAPTVGVEAVRHLLWWLPKGHELSFYDQYFPGTQDDPGAYVRIQRWHDSFRFRLGNHGWFQDSQSQSPELLAAWIVLNLQPKPGVDQSLRSLSIHSGMGSAQASGD